MEEFAAMLGLALVEEGDEGSWLGVGLVLVWLYAKDLKVLVDLGVEVVMREFNLLGERVEDPLMEHLLQQSQGLKVGPNQLKRINYQLLGEQTSLRFFDPQLFEFLEEKRYISWRKFLDCLGNVDSPGLNLIDIRVAYLFGHFVDLLMLLAREE